MLISYLNAYLIRPNACWYLVDILWQIIHISTKLWAFFSYTHIVHSLSTYLSTRVVDMLLWFDYLADFINDFSCFIIFSILFFYFIMCMHYSGVISTTKISTNSRQGGISEFSRKIHSNLSRKCDISITFFSV